MTALATFRDFGFEEWLGKINTACGRFCAKTLGPGFSGAMQEFRAHALRLSVVDVSQARLYRTPREIARSDGAHFYRLPTARQRVDGAGRSPDGALSRRHHADRRLTAQQLHLPARFAPNLLLLPRGCLPVPPPCAQRLGQSSARCASAASWC